MNATPYSKVIRTAWAARPLTALLLAASAGLAGCSQSDRLPKLQVYKVTGKVLLSNGKPLTTGFISFVPKGDLAITPGAKIEPDGTFTVVTGGSGEGAPSGEYKVRIEAPELRPDPKTKKTLIPPRYADEDSSRIVVTVLPQENHLDPITLK